MSDSFLTPILVSGVDARTFLQGQLSCDVDNLSRDHSLLASLNSAQGRVQAVLTLTAHTDGILLSVVTPMVERTIQRLRKYVLRSKVKIDVADASLAQAPSPAPHAQLLTQLRAGIPHVFPETHEAFVAQMLNLDVLGGISFEKGCYTGQEIIARAHYRGAVKRRMFRFAANCSPPKSGDRLLANGEHAGDVVYAAATDNGSELLAVVSFTQIDAALSLENGMPLSLLDLPYAIPDRGAK